MYLYPSFFDSQTIKESVMNITSPSSGTTTIDLWSLPELVSVHEVGESVEMIYKQTSRLNLSVYPSRQLEERVYKIVYSCKDGKWHKSEPIYGKIIPAQSEYFEFER
jgi:hypothetical protein